MTRILSLLLAIASFAACGEGGGGLARADEQMRFDTAAGFRLGMLLPEARAAAAARGDEMHCELGTTHLDPAMYPDSVWRSMSQMELCDPGGYTYEWNLLFEQGSLRAIVIPVTDDWDMIPVDTLVRRLARDYGKPSNRHTYTTAAGKTEHLITWNRKGDPSTMGLRCPDGATAGSCVREHRLFVPKSAPGENE